MSGKELRRRRLALGLSQPELAAQLGIHHNTLCRWERQGVSRLSVEHAQATLERLEHQPKLDVYRREDPRPLGKAWCNAYGTHWDDELIVVHAATKGKAKSAIANELGVDFAEAKIRRLPAMDDLPITAWNLLITESCGWLECQGMGCLYLVRSEDGRGTDGPWSYAGNEGVEMAAVQGPHGTAYCSAACRDRDLALKGQTA